MAALRTSVGKNEIISAIPGTKGLICNLERRLQCTRAAIKNAIAQFPEIQQEMDDEEEREKEEVLNNLIDEAKAGDKSARELYLKARARDRGFGDKLEVSGANGQPLVFLHAVTADLTANARNGNASKQKRVSVWSGRAVEYHQKQTAEAKDKSVNELLANPAQKPRRK